MCKIYHISLLLSLITLAITIYLSLNGYKVYYTLGSGILTYIFRKFYFGGGSNSYYPDLSGKIIVITGGNSGIGYETAE